MRLFLSGGVKEIVDDITSASDEKGEVQFVVKDQGGVNLDMVIS